MNIGKGLRLIASIIICQAAGIIGSVFTVQNIPTWYAGLAKPFFAPPNWLFGPAWITLYFLMGVALFLVWEKGFVEKRKSAVKGKEKLLKVKAKIAVDLFAMQLVLNAIWSFLFFGLRNPFAGLIEIILMWVVIGLTIRAFYPVSKKAAWLLVPYILWVSFATMLNTAIVILNP